MVRSQHSKAAHGALDKQLSPGTFNLPRTQAQWEYLEALR